MTGAELAHHARSLIGSPFLLHGRDSACGLDCLGVLAAALSLGGKPANLPQSYTLRRRGEPQAGAIAHNAGFSPAAGAIMAGDVLLVRCSAVQLHVLVASDSGRFVHAHAGLGRVVESPADPAWKVLARWRIRQSGNHEHEHQG